MKYENEDDEIIEFCLKHNLIKKTEGGYVIRKYFFEILDFYDKKRGENYYGFN